MGTGVGPGAELGTAVPVGLDTGVLDDGAGAGVLVPALVGVAFGALDAEPSEPEPLGAAEGATDPVPAGGTALPVGPVNPGVPEVRR